MRTATQNPYTVFTLSIWTPYNTCSKIWTSAIYCPMLCSDIAEWLANSVDPDEAPRSAASHLGLHCLLRPVCPTTYGKHGTHDTPSHWKANKMTFVTSEDTGPSPFRNMTFFTISYTISVVVIADQWKWMRRTMVIMLRQSHEKDRSQRTSHSRSQNL